MASYVLAQEASADFSFYATESTIISIPETVTTAYTDVLKIGGITGLRVLRFVVAAAWAGGNLFIEGHDRFGASASKTVSLAGLGGTTVNDDTPWSDVTRITNTAAGSNAGRAVSVELRSVLCTPHAPVTSFVAAWDDLLGQQTVTSSDATNGWAALAGPLDHSYRLQYTITIS